MDRFLMETQTKWMIGGTPILGNLHMYSPNPLKKTALHRPWSTNCKLTYVAVSQAPLKGLESLTEFWENLAIELGKCW